MPLILSTIESESYIVAKILNNLIIANISAFNFTEEVNALTRTKNDCMVSFDVKSLFTMVHLDETKQICIKNYTSTYGSTDVKLFENLLKFAVKTSIFSMTINGISKLMAYRWDYPLLLLWKKLKIRF